MCYVFLLLENMFLLIFYFESNISLYLYRIFLKTTFEIVSETTYYSWLRDFTSLKITLCVSQFLSNPFALKSFLPPASKYYTRSIVKIVWKLEKFKMRHVNWESWMKNYALSSSKGVNCVSEMQRKLEELFSYMGKCISCTMKYNQVLRNTPSILVWRQNKFYATSCFGTHKTDLDIGLVVHILPPLALIFSESFNPLRARQVIRLHKLSRTLLPAARSAVVF